MGLRPDISPSTNANLKYKYMAATTESQDFFLVAANFIGAALDTSSVFAELANVSRDSDLSSRLRAKVQKEFEAAITFCERYPKFLGTQWGVIEERMQTLRDTVMSSGAAGLRGVH